MSLRSVSIALCLVFFLFSCARKPDYPRAPFDGANVQIDIRTLPEKTPQFYSLTIDGKKIDFFIVRIDGEIQSYFDACLECYPKKLGFRFDEGRMICTACNVRLPLEILKNGIGGCFPIHLKGTPGTDRYVITKEALMAGREYF